MKCLPFALTLFAVLAAVSPCRADGELRALQDSVVRWLAAHPDDLLAEAFTTAWSDEADGCVEVHLLRADSAMKARFRRCVHDSRRIRLAGFDPGTVPYPPAPEGGTAPAALFSMHAEYALYPCDADTVRSQSATPAGNGSASERTTPSAACTATAGNGCPTAACGTPC